MRLVSRLVLLAIGLSLAITPSPSSASHRSFQPLTGADKVVAFAASKVSAHSRTRAVQMLQHSARVQRVTLGQDGRTIEVFFRDGASVVLLPRIERQVRPPIPAPLSMAPRARPAAAAPGRALVLEPFADELGLGPEAGQEHIDLLTKAGFQVDVFRNEQVTIPVMERLSDYSVVYMLTHSGLLDNGHALVLLGETNQHPYTDLFKECSNETPPVCSVMQGIGQGSKKLSVAITDYFVTKHVGDFPNSSILFLNGCEIMSAPAFVESWRQKNVASVVGWDGKVDSAITELTAGLFFKGLTDGLTIDRSIQNLGPYAKSVWDSKETSLMQQGYGADTLSQILAGTPPPPTATAIPTARPVTPTPTAIKPAPKKCPKNASKKHGKCVCKKGYTMKKGKCVKKK
jgi:hypothetical protein